MKTLISCCGAIFILSSSCWADTLDNIIGQTESANPNVRIVGFNALQPYLAHDPIDPRAAAAVTNLLLLEAHGDAVDDDGDYFSDVIASVVNLDDPSTIPALVEVINTGNMVPKRLAQYGTAALGPVISRSSDPDWIVRKCVMITLLNMLSKQNVSLFSDPASMAQINNALSQGAFDSSPFVAETARSAVRMLPAAPPLTSGDACNGVYGGTFTGNVNVAPGQNCIINGAVTGNIQSRGGNIGLFGATVGGNVQINGGGNFSILSLTSIAGNLQVQNIPSGTAVNQICNSTIHQNLGYQNNGVVVQIGSPSPTRCGGNTVGGNLLVQNNSAPVQVFNNTVSGNLQDQDNKASTAVGKNNIGGNLQVQNNSGPSTQVTSNGVSNNLQCQNNSSITGSGNTARQKQGQCANF